jgi:hypothetical protein
MLRLTATLDYPLHLIGSGFGSGERLIAAGNQPAIIRPPKPRSEADQA